MKKPITVSFQGIELPYQLFYLEESDYVMLCMEGEDYVMSYYQNIDF